MFKLKLKVFLSFSAMLFSLFFVFQTPDVRAGDDACGGCPGSCYFQRSVSQWSCYICIPDYYCLGSAQGCANGDDSQCVGHGMGVCVSTCSPTGVSQCQGGAINQIVQCNNIGPGSCEWTGNINLCNDVGDVCTLTGSNLTYGCCGPGNCSGTPTVTPPPTETPPPPPPPPPPGCSFVEWTPGSCGCNGDPQKRYYTGSYSPAGCDSSVMCQFEPSTCSFQASCSISVPPITLSVSAPSQNALVSIDSQVNGSITSVSFISSDPSKATVTSPDSSPAFQTTATFVAPGTSGYTAVATMDDANLTQCIDANIITSENPPRWWQVGGSGDAVSTGNLISNVPFGSTFSLDGAAGFPGIPVFTNTNLTGTNTSSTGWRADSLVNIQSTENYSYDYFEDRLPSGLPTSTGSVNLATAGTLVNGYKVIVYDDPGGDFNLSGNVNIGSGKVVLFVRSGDFNINGKINVNDGLGFFMAIVNGNINIDPTVGGSVPDLEGIYYAQNQVFTGTTGSASDLALTVRGTVIGISDLGGSDGVVLERDLANNTVSAETFEFAPDQLMRFPPFLGKRNVRWVEVAP